MYKLIHCWMLRLQFYVQNHYRLEKLSQPLLLNFFIFRFVIAHRQYILRRNMRSPRNSTESEPSTKCNLNYLFSSRTVDIHIDYFNSINLQYKEKVHIGLVTNQTYAYSYCMKIIVWYLSCTIKVQRLQRGIFQTNAIVFGNSLQGDSFFLTNEVPSNFLEGTQWNKESEFY